MILVLGGQGQLGQELQRKARQQVVALTAADRAVADITDASALSAALARLRPSVVVNCAAYTAVDRAESEPDLARRINVGGARNAAVAATAAGIPFIHLSTDFVFDGSKADAWTEDDPVAPLGVYGRSKADGEAEVRQACPRHVILRTAWVYGVFGHNFLKTMLRLALEKPELRIVSDQRGCPTGTPGLASAILTIAARLADAGSTGDDSLWGTYHLGGAGVATWHEFATGIVTEQAKRTGMRPPVHAIPTSEYPAPARRPVNSVLDSRLARRTFGVELPGWREEMPGIVGELLGEGRT